MRPRRRRRGGLASRRRHRRELEVRKSPETDAESAPSSSCNAWPHSGNVYRSNLPQMPTKLRRTTVAGRHDRTTWARRNQSAGESMFKVVPAARAVSASFWQQTAVLCLTIDASGSLDAQSWSIAANNLSSPLVAFRAQGGSALSTPLRPDGTLPDVARASVNARLKDGWARYNACTRGGRGWPRRRVGCGARGVRLSKQNGARAPLKT